MTQVTISLTDLQLESLFNTEGLLDSLSVEDKRQIALELYKEAMKVEVGKVVEKHKTEMWYRSNMSDIITPIIKELLKENEELKKIVNKIIPTMLDNIPEIAVVSLSSLMIQNLNGFIDNKVFFNPIITDMRTMLNK